MNPDPNYRAAAMRHDNELPEAELPTASGAVACARCNSDLITVEGDDCAKNLRCRCNGCGREDGQRFWNPEDAIEGWNAWQETEGNDRLRQSHAELLEALQDILACVNVRIDDPRCATFDKARAIVANAERGTR